MPYFREIVSTEFYTLPGETVPMTNTNYLIDESNGREYYYPYATGIKTGYTSLAGKCLVSMAEKGDTHLMCVALGGKFDSGINYAMIGSINLYKWAFRNFTDYIGVDLKPQYKSVQIGESVKLEPMITEINIDEIPEFKWISSNPEIAEVDKNGVVTAHKFGEAKIRVETQTGDFDVCKVGCGYYNGLDVTSRYGDYTNGEKNPINWHLLRITVLILRS